MKKYEDGWRKVAQNGGSFVTAKLFNVVTKETDSVVVRDYDYGDGSRDCDYWYDMEIDEEARREWMHANGLLLEGDTVKVVKGRKIPVGYVGKIVAICPIKKYHRWIADYAVFEDGRSTDIENCVLA